jgi:uncharacterized protein (DUF302 family)
MNSIINVTHQCIQLKSNYDVFTKNIETLLKHLDSNYAEHILDNPGAVENYLKSLSGDTGLILFGEQNHGGLLNIYGKPRKAKQYAIGNPLIAIQMTQHDIRAGLYAPLRIIVYEGDDNLSYVEYDLPSSLFGQFGKDEILAVAKGLDEKLHNAITVADNAL